jgi:hypothetical protein
MKKSRFTDIQIMDALNRADAGIRIWRHGRVDDGGDEGLNVIDDFNLGELGSEADF